MLGCFKFAYAKECLSRRFALRLRSRLRRLGRPRGRWRGRQPHGRVRDRKVPCVRLWEQMSAAERARLWPFLDEVAKTSYWRQMSGDDRRELRKHLSSAEREQLRNRYSVKHEGERRAGRRLGGMCDEKRSELRRQVMEVHMQFRRSHRADRPAAEAVAP